MCDKAKLYVYAENEKYHSDAQALAKRLQVECISDMSQTGCQVDGETGSQTDSKTAIQDLILLWGKEGLSLKCGKLSMRGDFTTMIPRVREGKWQHEMLVKASKLKNAQGKLTAIDATAGMGEDALLLAAAGYHVTMYEYDPIIAALLKDALRRAKKVPQLSEIVDRMQLVEDDSITAMSRMDETVDLIYLDPMFPARQKSALIKKKFQLLQKIESPCMDEKELLEAAVKVRPKRIVVKRPAKGLYIAGKKPDFSFQGKAIRYDCFSFA